MASLWNRYFLFVAIILILLRLLVIPGSEIAALVMESNAFDYLDAPVERVTGAYTPMPYSLPLERAALPQKEDIERAVKRTIVGQARQ
jgi:pyruvate/2-oxoglutarate/acetoin dehydrogenase E1 component